MASGWGALEAQMQAALVNTVSQATEKSFDDLQQNVDRFYNSAEGTYKRTGQLRASPQNDGVFSSGNSAVGQISVNTGTQYDPAGRDTETIYGYAESGGLVGQGGFYAEMEEKVQENLDEAARKNFK